MPPGAKGGSEGLDPSCSELHDSQEIAAAKLVPPLTLFQRCYRHLKVSRQSVEFNDLKQYYCIIEIEIESYLW